MSLKRQGASGVSSTSDTSNFFAERDDPAKAVSIRRANHSLMGGGPAMVSARVRRATNWASSMKNGTPPQWSAW